LRPGGKGIHCGQIGHLLNENKLQVSNTVDTITQCSATAGRIIVFFQWPCSQRSCWLLLSIESQLNAAVRSFVLSTAKQGCFASQYVQRYSTSRMWLMYTKHKKWVRNTQFCMT